MIVSPFQLRQRGVLGMNQRNADYVMRYNPRQLFPLVDDKLKTKQLAIDAGIAVPELYAVVEINHQLKKLDQMLAPYEQVVIKPAHGSGGNGILVITEKLGNHYKTASGELVSLNTVRHYISNILSGMYSLGGLPDQAFLEYCVQFDPVFDKVSFKGVPDIRVIILKGVPVTAMIRLPTSTSGGKANLHQGAVGAGIDLVSGLTQGGVVGNLPIETHPDTFAGIGNIQIPHWDDILHIAVKCADTVGLGYLGVDIVLDKTLGPLMLELNARPGLNVQIANQKGLLHSLQAIEKIDLLPADISGRVALARELAI